MDDEDAALQLPHTLLLHGHLAAVHIQGLSVQLWQEQGSPSTGGCGVSRRGTFRFLHGRGRSPRSAEGALHPHAAAAAAEAQESK